MDITIKNLQTKIPIRLPRVNDVVRCTLRHFPIIDAELSFVFVAPSRMRMLNAKYLKHDYVTDVLTFDYSPGARRQAPGVKKISHPSPIAQRPTPYIYGEIIICPSVAFRNAKKFGVSLQKEIELYIIHGILHLMGYDDHAPKDIARMRKKEREIINLLRIG